MQLKLDVKTLVVGIAVGMVITVVLGVSEERSYVGGGDKADFGIAVQNQGAVIARASNGDLFYIDAKDGKATRVMYEPTRGRNRPLNLNTVAPAAAETEKYAK